MKSYRKELWFEIPRRRALVNITGEVEQCLRDSGIREGRCLVNTSRFPGVASAPVAVGSGLVFGGLFENELHHVVDGFAGDHNVDVDNRLADFLDDLNFPGKASGCRR